MKNIVLFLLLLLSIGVKAQETKGLVTIGTVAPTDSLDEYYTHDDFFGKTATKIVKTLVQRDNIPIARRMSGMRVFVQDEKNTYRLEDCLDNNCWIVDRVDTLKNGTVSTGKITVQAHNSDPSFLYDAYTFNGYQRFGVTKNGTLISGRRMPAFINVDALAVIGDRNTMLATDGFAFGKDVIVNGDTSAGIGYNLESTYFNSLLIGRGKDRANRVKNRWPYSTSIGAFQAIPQIELTKDTIRLNSNVLWWNGAPIVGNTLLPTNNIFSWNNTNSYYEPYASKALAGAGKFYYGTDAPTSTSRLNFDGALWSSYLVAQNGLTSYGSFNLTGPAVFGNNLDVVGTLTTPYIKGTSLGSSIAIQSDGSVNLPSGAQFKINNVAIGGSGIQYEEALTRNINLTKNGKSALLISNGAAILGAVNTESTPNPYSYIQVNANSGFTFKIDDRYFYLSRDGFKYSGNYASENVYNLTWLPDRNYVDSVANPSWTSVVAASTITAPGLRFKITGTTTINTINIPVWDFVGDITVVTVDGADFSNTGNIVKAVTASENDVYFLMYDPAIQKWYIR
jgi:hypothetical protein